jgi:hypothetical protein
VLGCFWKGSCLLLQPGSLLPVWLAHSCHSSGLAEASESVPLDLEFVLFAPGLGAGAIQSLLLKWSIKRKGRLGSEFGKYEWEWGHGGKERAPGWGWDRGLCVGEDIGLSPSCQLSVWSSGYSLIWAHPPWNSTWNYCGSWLHSPSHLPRTDRADSTKPMPQSDHLTEGIEAPF